MLRRSLVARPESAARASKRASLPASLLVSRHTRLLRVASILDADCTTEPDLIARGIGISRRTLYRDLAVLRKVGIRLEYSRLERRYRLDSLYTRIALALTEPEAEAFLEWAAKQIKGAGENAGPFERAVLKISRILCDELEESENSGESA